VRLFVAVYPPPAVVAHLSARITELRIGEAAAAGVGVRLADPTQAHVTLAFLEPVAADRLEAVERSLDQAAWRFRDSGAAPPRLHLAGSGTFGQGRSTIVWVDLRGDVAELHLLGRLVRSRLRANHLCYDEKPLRPHLTVARPGARLPSAEVTADVAALQAYQGPQWRARELVLTRSHPGPRPSHERVAAWQL